MSLPDKLQKEALDILSSLKSYFEHQKISGIKFLYFHKTDPSGSLDPEGHQLSHGHKGALLEKARKELGDCNRCRLHANRKNIVYGEGNPNARLVFAGEAPGGDEDEQGRPFVGEAGRLLTKIINAMGLKRAEVYIANIIKCRPPQNRDPADDEIRTCIPFLQKQLQIIQPRIICTLGRVATGTILETDKGITELRGKFHRLGDIMVMPTYHPSYLLKNRDKKKETWLDMQMVQKKYFETSDS